MYIDVIPLFSSPLATSKLEVDARKILEKLKTLEFELTDYLDEDVGTAGDIYISSSLSILDYFPELKTEIMLKLDSYIKNVLMYKDVKFKITTSWGTKTSPGGYGQEHMHTNSWFSGVWYPEDSSSITFVRRDRALICPGKPEEWNLFNSPEWEMTPSTNNLFIFNSTLNHRINKNTSDNDRYSIAFNVLPQGKIGTGDSTVYISTK